VSYATQAQLVERYGQTRIIDLTDRATPATGAIVTAVVDRALADTDAAIDGYLKARYRLPLTSAPPLLRDLALAIAFYKLHVNSVTEKARADYEDAMRTLREVAAGTVRLDAEGVEPEGGGTTGVRATDRARDLTPDNMKGFV